RLRESVAEVTDRLDEVRGGPELLAKALHVGVDGPGVGVSADPPNVAQEMLAREHLLLRRHEYDEQPALERGERDLSLADEDPVRDRIHAKRSRLKDGRSDPRAARLETCAHALAEAVQAHRLRGIEIGLDDEAIPSARDGLGLVEDKRQVGIRFLV